MSDDKPMNAMDGGVPEGTSPPPAEQAEAEAKTEAKAEAQAEAQTKAKTKTKAKAAQTRVVVRSLTGAAYRRAGIEFGVIARTVSVGEAALAIIRADANLEVTIDEA